jgi:hypothetical protein
VSVPFQNPTVGSGCVTTVNIPRCSGWNVPEALPIPAQPPTVIASAAAAATVASRAADLAPIEPRCGWSS